MNPTEKSAGSWKHQPFLTVKEFKRSSVTYLIAPSWFWTIFCLSPLYEESQTDTLSFSHCLHEAQRTAELCCCVISAARLPEVMSLVFPVCRCPASALSSQHVVRCLHAILTYATAFHCFFFSSLLTFYFLAFDCIFLNITKSEPNSIFSPIRLWMPVQSINIINNYSMHGKLCATFKLHSRAQAWKIRRYEQHVSLTSRNSHLACDHLFFQLTKENFI